MINKFLFWHMVMVLIVTALLLSGCNDNCERGVMDVTESFNFDWKVDQGDYKKVYVNIIRCKEAL